MSTRASCLICGRPVSRHAASCPGCGARQPQRRLGSQVGLAVLLLLLVVAAGAMILV